MFNTIRQQLARLSLTEAADAGQRRFTRMLNAVQTLYIDLVITAVVANTAGAIRNRGRPSAMFDYIGIDENGRDQTIIDARSLAYYSDTFAPSALTRSALTAVGVGPDTLVETIRIPFAHPFSLDPMETAFLERDARLPLQLFVQMNGDPVSRIAAGGGDLTSLTIDAVQVVNKSRAKRPLFIPTIRQSVFQVNGTDTRQEMNLRTSRFTRALLIQQDDTTDGEVNDIINGIVLRGDLREIIGPTPVDFDALVRASEFEFGGAVGPAAAAGNGSYLLLNFQQNGRLSNVLNPKADVNLRLEVDGQPGAGAGTALVRVTHFELDHDPNMTDVNGRPLVEPLPFAL